MWRDGIYLSLANTLFLYEKTENASECCDWRSVPMSSRNVRVNRMFQKSLEFSRQFQNVPGFCRMFQKSSGTGNWRCYVLEISLTFNPIRLSSVVSDPRHYFLFHYSESVYPGNTYPHPKKLQDQRTLCAEWRFPGDSLVFAMSRSSLSWV